MLVAEELAAGAREDHAPVLEHVAAAASASAWRVFCSTSSTVVPARLISATMSKISCTIMGASPSDGSSSMRRRGRAISARPMASICCSPPDMVPGGLARALAPARGKSAKHALQALAPVRAGRAGVGAQLEVLAARSGSGRSCGPPAPAPRRAPPPRGSAAGRGARRRSRISPARGPQQPGDGAQHGRLARAVGAHHRQRSRPPRRPRSTPRSAGRSP